MTRLHFSLLVFALLTTGGCASLVVTGATTAGATAAQERSVGHAVDDATILAAIKFMFTEKDVNDLLLNVSVNVVEGRVLLTGAVKKPDTAIEAIRLSWKAEGVREVINEIQVTDTSSWKNYAQDAWISTQVRTRLLLEKYVKSINYNVETVNGTVFIIGIAQDQQELDKVTYLARTTKYVREVISYAVLKTDPRRQNL